MPRCGKCGWYGASAELRRTSKRHLCKDKLACVRRLLAVQKAAA